MQPAFFGDTLTDMACMRQRDLLYSPKHTFSHQPCANLGLRRNAKTPAATAGPLNSISRREGVVFLVSGGTSVALRRDDGCSHEVHFPDEVLVMTKNILPR